MPPSSKRRRRNLEHDPGAQIPDSSPSRSAAKRRRTQTRLTPPPPPPPQYQDDEVPPSPSSASTSTAELQEDADAVIPFLSVAKDPVVVATDWANTTIETSHVTNVSAYAKIAGRHWTYYVKHLNVNIGRPPDAHSRQATETGAQSSPALPSGGVSTVHIDLGPSKLISRLHAEIFFDVDAANWKVMVNGRNGLMVNNSPKKRGESANLKSGDVIEIAATQMMFLTAEDKAEIHPMFLDVIRGASDGKDLDRWNGQPHAHPENSNRPSMTSSSRIGAAPSSNVNSEAKTASAPASFVRPSTPIQSPVKSKQKARGTKPSPAKLRGKKESPAKGLSLTMDSTEDINYSLDAQKPNCSYATLISYAIFSTEDEMLTLSGIYEWIKFHFAYFRDAENTGWQVSFCISDTYLEGFEKIPRRTDEPGKGMKWRIKPESRQEMIENVIKQNKKTSYPSATKSPIANDPTNNSNNPFGRTGIVPLKTSPTSETPPLSAYPLAAQESYTPSRGPRTSAYSPTSAAQALPTFQNHKTHLQPDLTDEAPSLPVRTLNSFSSNVANADSPPALSSSLYFYDGPSASTPAPKIHNPTLAAPSTARLPSSYIMESSPAPFWKYGSLLGSTPARANGDLSPVKTGRLQSSSPPPAISNGHDSPTRGRGLLDGLGSRGNVENQSGIKSVILDDEDEMGGIDLARGFQTIGSYHKQMRNAAS